MSFAPPSRRARQSDSLAALVTFILDELQCPVATPAMRVILTDRGRDTKAEQLSRLAAYQREDFQRAHIPPPLCWTIEPDGTATTPRWWALSEWRLGRRIRTEDASQIWLAHLAVWLTTDLAERPRGRDSAVITLALGTAARVLGPRVFDVPTTTDEWMRLRAAVYGPYQGALNNRTGLTGQQTEAEARLTSRSAAGFDLLFGASAKTR
jgi:hypothetical protein